MKAVIFDMDGVIADTQKFHALSESELLSSRGINLTPEEITATYVGMPDREWMKKVFDEHNVNVDILQIIQEKYQRMFDLGKGKIKPIPGAIKLIKEIYQKQIILAVASSSPLIFIDLVLRELNLKEKFQVVVAGEEVKRGKPDPEIFLLAAKRLQINPQDCLVIEDGVSGMIAAKEAGMKCVGLKEDLSKDYPADLMVDDLRKLKVSQLKRL